MEYMAGYYFDVLEEYYFSIKKEYGRKTTVQ